MAEFATLITRLEVDSKNFKQGLNDATKQAVDSASSMTDRFSSVAGSIAKLTVGVLALGAAFGSALFYQMAKTSEGIEKLALLSDKIGISTARIQEFSYAASFIGVTQEETNGILDSAAQSFQAIEAGVGRASRRLKQFGIDTQELKGLDTIGALSRLSELTEGLPSAERAKIFEVVAGGLSKMIPLLKDGGSELKKLASDFDAFGGVLSQTQIDKALKFDDSLDRMRGMWKIFTQQLTVELAEPFEKGITYIQNMIQASGGIQTVARAISVGVLDAVKGMFQLAQVVVSAIEDLAGMLQETMAFFKNLRHPVDYASGKATEIYGGIAAGLMKQTTGATLVTEDKPAAGPSRLARAETALGKASDFINNLFVETGLNKGVTTVSTAMLDAGQATRAFAMEAKKAGDGLNNVISNMVKTNGQSELQRILKGENLTGDSSKPVYEKAQSDDFDRYTREVVQLVRTGSEFGLQNSLQSLQNILAANANQGKDVSGMLGAFNELKDFVKGAGQEQKVKVSVEASPDFIVKIINDQKMAKAQQEAVRRIAADEARGVAN